MRHYLALGALTFLLAACEHFHPHADEAAEEAAAAAAEGAEGAAEDAAGAAKSAAEDAADAAKAAGDAAVETASGWKDLFDGKSLDGWLAATENAEGFRVEDGQIIVNGNRSHLFYVGDDEPFVDFELEVEVMTRPNSNSGVYFHTQYQETGWPKYGFEMQVNNSYKDAQKTASLYGVVKITEAPAKDNEWFTMRLKVQGDEVTVHVDGEEIVHYHEPEGTEAGKDFTRKIDSGTFALQAHDPGSTVHYRKIRARRL